MPKGKRKTKSGKRIIHLEFASVFHSRSHIMKKRNSGASLELNFNCVSVFMFQIRLLTVTAVTVYDSTTMLFLIENHP